MKQTCGYDYTNKLQSMYADIAVSKNLTDKFRQKVDATTPVDLDFRIKVLTHGCWPLSKDLNVNLPIELTKVVDRFITFYHSQHSGRKLMWLYNLSKAEVIMNSIKQRYCIKVRSTGSNVNISFSSSISTNLNHDCLQANTLQMAVLLQFNEQATLSVQQLHEYTGIDLKQILGILDTLIKLKLLKRCDQTDLCETSNIEMNALYNEYVSPIKHDQMRKETRNRLGNNSIFTSDYRPKIRFDITGKLESERRAEQRQTLERIDEDRRLLIEATIVRIMKMRKILSNRILIGEVLSQLTPKFAPKVPHIKVKQKTETWHSVLSE